MRTLIISLVIFILSINVSAQWYQQNSGTTANLNAVTFVDTNNGFAVGWNGIILKTTNGGLDWNSQQIGSFARLTGVSFIDENNGWVVGDSSIIIHTTDGGESWVRQ